MNFMSHFENNNRIANLVNMIFIPARLSFKALSQFWLNSRNSNGSNFLWKKFIHFYFSDGSIESHTNWKSFCTSSALTCDKKSEHPEKSNEKVKMIFHNYQGYAFEVIGTVGQTVLEASQEAGLDVAGACGGTLSCTTCHVYVDEECEKIFEEPSSQEEDLLDEAPFLKANSRLSCQLIVKKELEGRVFTLPKGTKNFAVDGHVFEQH